MAIYEQKMKETDSPSPTKNPDSKKRSFLTTNTNKQHCTVKQDARSLLTFSVVSSEYMKSIQHVIIVVCCYVHCTSMRFHNILKLKQKEE